MKLGNKESGRWKREDLARIVVKQYNEIQRFHIQAAEGYKLYSAMKRQRDVFRNNLRKRDGKDA